MATACFSLTSVANGSFAVAVVGRAESGRQAARLHPGSASITAPLSRDPKTLAAALSFPFGGSFFSKAAMRRGAGTVAALDLQSGFDLGKESGFDLETEPSFDSNEDSEFNNTSGFGISAEKTLGFGQAPPFGRDFGGGDGPVTQGNKLYVGNLPWSCDSQQLADVFQEAGVVDVVEVIYDKETGRSRGFGFVTMASSQDAETAISKLDGYQIGGRSIRVNFPLGRGVSGSRPAGGFGSAGGFGGRNEVDNSSRVFVGNLPWGIDDVSLEELCRSHGSIIEARVIYDRETGRSRGFGFVTFSSPSEANRAVSNLNGMDYEGRPLRVNLAGERPAPRF